MSQCNTENVPASGDPGNSRGLDDHESQAVAGTRHWAWPSLGAATLIVVLSGLVWRTVRYALAFPLWGDEAFVAVNFLTRDFAGLARPLEYFQIVPPGFLWSEWLAVRTFGASERALTVGPVLVGRGVAPLVLAILPRGRQPADRLARGRHAGRVVLSGAPFHRSEALRDRSAGIAHAAFGRLAGSSKHSLTKRMADAVRGRRRRCLVLVRRRLSGGYRRPVFGGDHRPRAIPSAGGSVARVCFLDLAELGSHVCRIRRSAGPRGRVSSWPGNLERRVSAACGPLAARLVAARSPYREYAGVSVWGEQFRQHADDDPGRRRLHPDGAAAGPTPSALLAPRPAAGRPGRGRPAPLPVRHQRRVMLYMAPAFCLLSARESWRCSSFAAGQAAGPLSWAECSRSCPWFAWPSTWRCPTKPMTTSCTEAWPAGWPREPSLATSGSFSMAPRRSPLVNDLMVMPWLQRVGEARYYLLRYAPVPVRWEPDPETVDAQRPRQDLADRSESR